MAAEQVVCMCGWAGTEAEHTRHKLYRPDGTPRAGSEETWGHREFGECDRCEDLEPPQPLTGAYGLKVCQPCLHVMATEATAAWEANP